MKKFPREIWFTMMQGKLLPCVVIKTKTYIFFFFFCIYFEKDQSGSICAVFCDSGPILGPKVHLIAVSVFFLIFWHSKTSRTH